MGSMQHQGLMDVARRDPRYAYEAYEFLFEALGHTQSRLGRVPPDTGSEPPGPEFHVSGPELVEGYLDLAKERFGRLARVVLHLWGIDASDDIGEVVFNLINADLLSKTDSDCKEHFRGLFDLDDVLLNAYQISWDA
jgi:uncharacterized repeat protein (TIGR04138 family)